MNSRFKPHGINEVVYRRGGPPEWQVVITVRAPDAPGVFRVSRLLVKYIVQGREGSQLVSQGFEVETVDCADTPDNSFCSPTQPASPRDVPRPTPDPSECAHPTDPALVLACRNNSVNRPTPS